MMKKVEIRYIVPIFIFLLIGCGKETVDTTPPTVEVQEYIPAAIEDEICGSQQPVVFQLTGGEQLTFDVIFNDNQALSQYKIDIHNNFDCHGHGGGSAPSVSTPNVNNLTTDWTVLEIQNISGESAPVIRTLNVPENVTAGNYHFNIQVIDESGNDSPLANISSLKIKNPNDDVPPQIIVQKPSTSSLIASRGDNIRFTGQVNDNHSLSEGGNGILYLSYTDLSSGNTFATDKAFPFDANVDINYNFDFKYQIPQTLVTGSYRFSLGANDGVRNVAPFIFFGVEISD